MRCCISSHPINYHVWSWNTYINYSISLSHYYYYQFLFLDFLLMTLGLQVGKSKIGVFWERRIFFYFAKCISQFIYVIFNFFQQNFMVFNVKIFHIFCGGFLISDCICGFVYFSLQFYQFLLHAFRSTVTTLVNI